jgi:hypothetical protein
MPSAARLGAIDPPEVFHGRPSAGRSCSNSAPGQVLRRVTAGRAPNRVALLGVTSHPRIEVDYASVTRVELDANGVATLVSLNETGHFDAQRTEITPHQSGR